MAFRKDHSVCKWHLHHPNLPPLLWPQSYIQTRNPSSPKPMEPETNSSKEHVTGMVYGPNTSTKAKGSLNPPQKCWSCAGAKDYVLESGQGAEHISFWRYGWVFEIKHKQIKNVTLIHCCCISLHAMWTKLHPMSKPHSLHIFPDLVVNCTPTTPQQIQPQQEDQNTEPTCAQLFPRSQQSIIQTRCTKTRPQ